MKHDDYYRANQLINVAQAKRLHNVNKDDYNITMQVSCGQTKAKTLNISQDELDSIIYMVRQSDRMFEITTKHDDYG